MGGIVQDAGLYSAKIPLPSVEAAVKTRLHKSEAPADAKDYCSRFLIRCSWSATTRVSASVLVTIRFIASVSFKRFARFSATINSTFCVNVRGARPASPAFVNSHPPAGSSYNQYASEMRVAGANAPMDIKHGMPLRTVIQAYAALSLSATSSCSRARTRFSLLFMARIFSLADRRARTA